MADTTSTKVMGDVPAAFFGLLRAQVELGREVFQAWTGMAAPDVRDAWTTWAEMAPRPVCHVPEPCWMPIRLGECRSHASACARACVRLVVTNCDATSRTVRVRVEGDEGAKASPASLELGPMERATFEVCRSVPEGTEQGTVFENLVWVEGCRDHVLRWTVGVETAGLDSCHEIRVDDCPDHRHHWYDHFYCERGCVPRPRNPDG